MGSKVQVVEDEKSVVSAEQIDETVARINGLARESSLKLAQEIGRTVVENFYGGDPSVLRQKGPKDASLRTLAEHPDLSVSTSDLYRSISIYELCDRLGVWEWKHLTKSHFRAVLGLPDTKQAKLLQRAEEDHLTVAEVETAAKKSRKKDGRGRPPLPTFQKAITKLDKVVESGDLGVELEKVEQMDPEEVAVLYKKVVGAKLRLEELLSQLQSKVPGFSSDVDADLGGAEVGDG